MWHFKPKAPGDTIREPIHGEFFAADAISDPGMALVREGIQNSLDAARDGEKVLVRIYVSGEASAVDAAQAKPYFDGAWEHYGAAGSGLQPDEVPPSDAPCPFLAFEDFGTTGLEGDPAEPFRSRTCQKNHFYHFFRAEGQSDKDVSDRGSWGVGKHVFLRSSCVSTMFGVTVRGTDGRRLLMGKAVLKSHYLNAGSEYYQDGYFGIREDDSQLIMPVTDATEIDRFCRLFDLQRGTDAGLSVVVPWPDRATTDASLVRAVLRDYFYPILAGQLEVVVETPGVQTVLNAASLIGEVQRLGGDLVGELQVLLELAAWARALPEEQMLRLRMPDPSRGWGWSEGLFSEDVLRRLREAYQQGERFAIRVPVTVRRKDAQPQESFFDVYMVPDSGEHTAKPTFIREGVIIPRVDAPRARSVRALVVIDDLPLTSFLRDAENPSHTEWQYDGSNFRGKYTSGKTDLAFIKRSVHEIVRILTASERQEDPTLLLDLFSLPALPEEEDESPRTRQRRPAEGRGGEPPIPTPPGPRPQRFRIQKVRGGFSILPGDAGVVPPAELDIRVAYSVRRGSPLRRYSKADFAVDEPPVQMDPPPHNIGVLECAENRIRVAIRDPDFSLHVTGFDERRDLYVRVVAKENADGGATA